VRTRALSFFLICLAGRLLHPAIAPAQAEQILDFHSDIALQVDATLQVTETIAVVAAGNQIKHGMYREIPTRN
jgi:hypothetical protein